MLEIYEREKDWQQALDTAMGVDLKRNADIALRAAYYCCEIADERLAESDLLDARKFLKRALSLSKNCVRAHIALARIEMAQEHFKAAILHLKQVAEDSPENIAITLPLLFECTQLTNSFEQYRSYLSRLYHSTGQVAVMLALVDSYLQESDVDSAISMLHRELSKEPNLTVLHVLLEQQSGDMHEISPELIEVVKQVVDKVYREKNDFKCSQCGFSGNHLHWMCPSCKSWQTMSPAIEYIKQD